MRGESLRRRLFLLVAAGLLPLAAMAGMGLLYLAREQRVQAERAGLEVTRALASAVDAELGRTIAVLRGIGVSPALDTGDLSRYREVMRRTVETRPDWLTITIADISGQQLANTRRPYGEKLPIVLHLPGHHEAVRTQQPVVGPLTTSPGGETAVPVRVPVVRDGEVRYVITAAVKPDAFVELLTRQRLAEDWVVSIFDGAGQRIARSRRHTEFFKQPPAPSLARLIEQAKGDEGAGLTSALEGEEIYTAFTRSASSRWITAIGIPRTAVDAAAWRSVAAYGAGLLLSLALGSLAALFLARGIATPIARLAGAARALGRGEAVQLPHTGILEIREVGSALAAASQERAAHEAEREELLRREREARAAAEGANRAKDEFLAMLGHELRNPLGALSNASWLLRSASLDPEAARKARDVIARQVEHLARLTDDLLDAGRAMLGKIELRREPLDLASLVEDTLAILQGTHRVANHRLRTRVEPAWVNADRARVEQIVMNLVGNAVKFTPIGGNIAVSVARRGNEAVLRVEDDGAGMPAELVPRVFDPFVQGERSLDRAHGGLGIGLTLVRRLAELHGGSASAASPGPGGGSSFEVRLPAVEPRAKPAPAPRLAAACAPCDILIIEDNADAASTLRGLLELSGHRVRVARDGAEGLIALAERWPDAALIDIGLPGMDGYEVARRARATIDGKASTLLVALTGYGLEEDRARALEAGFDEHIVKPVDPEELQKLFAALTPQQGTDAHHHDREKSQQ